MVTLERTHILTDAADHRAGRHALGGIHNCLGKVKLQDVVLSRNSALVLILVCCDDEWCGDVQRATDRLIVWSPPSVGG